ncbi:ER membrane protein complex subunit 2-like [Danaus plexippus]|uniref:ER membrane protein complex subunit 2 n=1 Tax=Danaus plexippus plexippus TaxID=278856 RepID=A0A212F6U5_DANPL|nr:ER membrane protein complex subunit 2-like [Danaus plexippus]OWR49461.1 tetratricopeptide repeat protein 35-B [Danaus plexippus plexippus]
MSYNFENMSVNEIFDLYRQWRENNERRSEDIINTYLQHSIDENALQKLGTEKYVIIEQIIYAALDCHYYSLAKMWTLKLNDEFPNSLRVLRYRVLCLEAEGQYKKASSELENITSIHKTQAPACKRFVTIYKAMGLLPEAIKELVFYLKQFISDVEAWQELCEMYLVIQEYSKAAFCAEEQILHSPHHHLLHQRLADIRYTMGGVENMELAKTYYCQALKLNPDNMRALLGLFLVTNNLLGQYKSSGSTKRKEIWKLSQWVQSEISKRQKKAKTPASVPTLTNLMLTLAITE